CRMPPAERPVEPEPSALRSITTTSVRPRTERWEATLAPTTPPPTMTTAAVCRTFIGYMPEERGTRRETGMIYTVACTILRNAFPTQEVGLQHRLTGSAPTPDPQLPTPT